MLTFRARLAAALLATLGLTSAASAAPVAYDFSFVLGGFVDINGAPPLPPPSAQVTGSFTVTFDTALGYFNDTADVVVHTLNGVTVDSPIGFTYDPNNHFFFLGGTANNSNFVVVGTNDFVLTYDLTNILAPTFVPCNTPGFSCGANTGNPAYDTSGYTTTGNDSLWFIAAAQSNPNGTTVPEPATISLVLAAALGMARARRGFKR